MENGKIARMKERGESKHSTRAGGGGYKPRYQKNKKDWRTPGCVGVCATYVR